MRTFSIHNNTIRLMLLVALTALALVAGTSGARAAATER